MPVSMVGRDRELAELRTAWTGPRDAPRTVVVTGTAGAGKSMLITAALENFDPVPPIVLYGRARLHSPAPYDWLAAVLSAQDTTGLPVPADVLAWLAQHPGKPAQRYAPGALLRLAVKTVRALVRDGPAVIVAEDVHALDPASLNLLGELAFAPQLPALLIVTSRPPEDAPLVARTLAQLTGAPGTIRQHLGALTPVEVATLLERAYGAPVPADIAGAVRDRTAGNPYQLMELLAVEGGDGPAALAGMPGLLTAREVEVLSCLAAGMSNKQVARSLGISIRTVTVHVSNLLRKTRSSSRTEAALWALRRGLT